VLLVIALLGAALAAAVEAPARAVSLGRLRALGLPDPGLARVLAGELLVPVVVSVVVGVALGVGSAYATFGSLSLEQITGAAGAADPVLPWWLLLLVGAAVPAAILLVALTEWRRLRRKALAQLLRS
jgi:putative ABC transport system permease protein